MGFFDIYTFASYFQSFSRQDFLHIFSACPVLIRWLLRRSFVLMQHQGTENYFFAKGDRFGSGICRRNTKFDRLQDSQHRREHVSRSLRFPYVWKKLVHTHFLPHLGDCTCLSCLLPSGQSISYTELSSKEWVWGLTFLQLRDKENMMRFSKGRLLTSCPPESCHGFHSLPDPI